MLVLILRAPVPVVAVVAGIVALLTIDEFLKLTESYGVQPLRMPTYVFVGVFFLLLALNVGNEKPLLSTAVFVYCLGFAAAIAPFLALSILMLRIDLRSGYPAAAASVFAFTYIALPMGMLVQLRQQWAGAFYLLYLLLVVWAGDIFAYFVGKSVGRHLMAPRVSPKKTWEGAVASLVGSVGVGWLLFHYALPLSSALLADRAHRAPRRLVRTRAASDGAGHPADNRIEYCGATWRSRGVFDQAGRGREGFGSDSARARRHVRPDRRPAVCGSGIVVLHGLARDAVTPSG